MQFCLKNNRLKEVWVEVAWCHAVLVRWTMNRDKRIEMWRDIDRQREKTTIQRNWEANADKDRQSKTDTQTNRQTDTIQTRMTASESDRQEHNRDLASRRCNRDDRHSGTLLWPDVTLVNKPVPSALLLSGELEARVYYTYIILAHLMRILKVLYK